MSPILCNNRPRLAWVDKLYYCINCTDSITGDMGTFGYAHNTYVETGMMCAIGPVFKELEDFYAWAKEQGFCYHSLTENFVMLREFPQKPLAYEKNQIEGGFP